MSSSNLTPGQYQIGKFIFGEWTLFDIAEFDTGGWDINVQDSQVPLSDEIRFGRDSLKPGVIQIQMNARYNFLLGNVAALVANTKELDFSADPTVGQFTREWRADEVRFKYGELKPLYCCRQDGRVLVVYGRPGKFKASKPANNGSYRAITAEFRRSDTLAYSEQEWYTQISKDKPLTLVRSEKLGFGDAPTWVRFLLVGPMDHPIIQMGEHTIDLNFNLENGDVVEISSYPWERRCILLNNGESLASLLAFVYLEDLSIPAESPVEISWNATSINEVSVSKPFDGSFNPTDWYVDYSSGTGVSSVTGNALRWIDGGNQDRLVTYIFHEPTITNYQHVDTLLATPPELVLPGEFPCTNRLIGHANATRTEYCYWDISQLNAWYGFHSNGVDTVLSPVYDLGRTLIIFQEILADIFNLNFGGLLHLGDNWTYGADFGNGAGEQSSTLYMNGHVVAQFIENEAAQSAPLGPNNRLYGLGMYARTRLGIGQSTPGPMTGLNARDNAPANVQAGTNASGVFFLWRDAWQEI